MPKPTQNETKNDFMSRCIPLIIEEGKPQAQAVAMCNSIWEDSYDDEEKKVSEGIIKSINWLAIIR